jgi:hypothetical protein
MFENYSILFKKHYLVSICTFYVSNIIILFLYNASIMRLYCLYNGLTNIFFLFVFIFSPLLK